MSGQSWEQSAIVFASADTKGDATILVVQQHNNLENEGSESRKQSLEDPDFLKDDEEEMPIQGRSLNVHH